MIAALLLALVAQGGGGLTAEATLYMEAAEQGLVAEESWAVRNVGTTPIPADALVIRLPEDLKQARLEGDDSTGFKLGEDGKSVHGSAPLPPGETRMATIRYGLELDGSSRVLVRTMPFPVARARIILEERPGLTLASTERLTRSTRDLSGVQFVIWELSDVAEGKRVEFTLAGLPVRSDAPRYLAFVAALLVIAWAVWTLLRGGRATHGAHALTPLSGAARRERLVRAVELLDADHASGKVDVDQHARRRRALIDELAVVLRELDLDAGSAAAPKA